MKPITSILIILFIFLNKTNAQNDTCLQCNCFKNTSFSWKAFDTKQSKDFLVKGDSIYYYTNSIINMIKRINKTSSIKIKLLKVKNNVPYIKIINSTEFTQHMGSTGAMIFLSTLVFNITEIKGINKVYVSFLEGDHSGQPGFFTRDYFKKGYVICKE